MVIVIGHFEFRRFWVRNFLIEETADSLSIFEICLKTNYYYLMFSSVNLSIKDRNLLARKNIILGGVYIFFPILGVFIGTLIIGIKGIYAILFFSPLIMGGIWIVIYHFGLLYGIFLVSKEERVWVAKYKGEIVGSVSVRCKEKYSILQIIWVKPVFQRMGVGFCSHTQT